MSRPARTTPSADSTPKYVASTTLNEVAWRNSRIISGDIASEVARLKAVPGKDIGVHGSVMLVRYLIQHGVLDELKLAVFPAAAGTGDRLFEQMERPVRMRLVDTQRTDAGVVVLTYRLPSP